MLQQNNAEQNDSIWGHTSLETLVTAPEQGETKSTQIRKKHIPLSSFAINTITSAEKPKEYTKQNNSDNKIGH